MYELNLIVLKDMVDNELLNDIDHRRFWVFDDFENYGLGCTGVCGECYVPEPGFVALDDEFDYDTCVSKNDGCDNCVNNYTCPHFVIF